MATEYPKVFQGIGKLKNYEVKLHIDTSIQPVTNSIPFTKKVSVELKKLERNCEVCLCINMRMANRAIQRERHPTPTVDNLVNALNGSTVFSKLDQLVLAQENRYITTFVTHERLRRYTRLNFCKIFQNAIRGNTISVMISL